VQINKRYRWPTFTSKIWWRQAKKWTEGPTFPGPSNIWGPSDRKEETLAISSTSERPRRAIMGSAGLDLHSTTRLVLMPQMGVQPIETDFKGPLPKDTMGLLFRRSLSALKGLQITPGVINPDYKGVVKILVASLSGISLISPGDRIAQLLLLPSLHKYFPANNKIRGESQIV
jgi:dUTPase